MHSKNEQVSQLLTNANQCLNFLRIVLDDLIVSKDKYAPEIQSRIYTVQKNYKTHKAVLTNIENLLIDRKYSLTEKLLKRLAISLRVRISRIIDDAINLDRLR